MRSATRSLLIAQILPGQSAMVSTLSSQILPMLSAMRPAVLSVLPSPILPMRSILDAQLPIDGRFASVDVPEQCGKDLRLYTSKLPK